MDSEETRRALLLASLPHVPFDGWSRAALLAGAEDLGLDVATALNAFPREGTELIEAFSDWADQAMLEKLGGLDLPAMRVRDRIATAVRLRLELLAPHREAVRRGLAFLALPGNLALGLKSLYRTVDAIWYAAGDRATDYNFYSKRLLLSGVYSSTLVYWLNDSSEDFAQTWAVLDRRITEVLKVAGNLGKAVKGALDLPDRLAARFGAPGLRR